MKRGSEVGLDMKKWELLSKSTWLFHAYCDWSGFWAQFPLMLARGRGVGGAVIAVYVSCPFPCALSLPTACLGVQQTWLSVFGKRVKCRFYWAWVNIPSVRWLQAQTCDGAGHGNTGAKGCCMTGVTGKTNGNQMSSHPLLEFDYCRCISLPGTCSGSRGRHWKSVWVQCTFSVHHHDGQPLTVKTTQLPNRSKVVALSAECNKGCPTYTTRELPTTTPTQVLPFKLDASNISFHPTKLFVTQPCSSLTATSWAIFSVLVSNCIMAAFPQPESHSWHTRNSAQQCV